MDAVSAQLPVVIRIRWTIRQVRHCHRVTLPNPKSLGL
ncbi:unnamed protein product [Schistosoma curassoni]|uniref:Uncharacterized protein n=1 Tax=Schistosoma curassoni TaxID=6186 RepID=A0A183JJR7_9TREM|nr:unnamed protein product [Schistosoma curassoni]